MRTSLRLFLFFFLSAPIFAQQSGGLVLDPWWGGKMGYIYFEGVKLVSIETNDEHGYVQSWIEDEALHKFAPNVISYAMSLAVKQEDDKNYKEAIRYAMRDQGIPFMEDPENSDLNKAKRKMNKFKKRQK
ncbi:MAG: hypothetical protein V1647_04460 [Pseudomonadota bacterium]